MAVRPLPSILSALMRDLKDTAKMRLVALLETRHFSPKNSLWDEHEGMDKSKGQPFFQLSVSMPSEALRDKMAGSLKKAFKDRLTVGREKPGALIGNMLFVRAYGPDAKSACETMAKTLEETLAASRTAVGAPPVTGSADTMPAFAAAPAMFPRNRRR